VADLRSSDVRAVLNGAHALLDRDGPDDFASGLLEVVSQLVPSDTVTFNEVDLTHGTARILTTGPDPEPEQARAFVEHATDNPLVAYQAGSGDGSPRRLSDFITARQFRRRPIYPLVYGPLGVESQLAFTIEESGQSLSGVALNRGHRDFSPRDVQVLALLRPLLAAMRAASPDTEDENAAEQRLTPRQREILELVAAGASNTDVALMLGISPRTVAKHLELAYRALEVTNRTAAAARVSRRRAYAEVRIDSSRR
jgi:DNA-binding CsgD family transcriptional regulator